MKNLIRTNTFNILREISQDKNFIAYKYFRSQKKGNYAYICKKIQEFKDLGLVELKNEPRTRQTKITQKGKKIVSLIEKINKILVC